VTGAWAEAAAKGVALAADTLGSTYVDRIVRDN
jgi:hypothetical protein